MQTPEWKLLFSQHISSSVAWGKSVRDEHVTTDSYASLLQNANGAIFLVIIGTDPGDILAFDFGRFWDICTYRRWTTQVITYRAGDSGMCLMFPTPTSLDRFEKACDRNLPVYAAETSPPMLEHLRDLGLISAPKVFGSFLLDGRPEARRPHHEQACEEEYERFDSFLLRNWAGAITRPSSPSGTEGAHSSTLNASASSLREEADTDEGTGASLLSDLSDLAVTDLDVDDFEGLADEAGVLLDDSVSQRFRFPGSFM